ncbi:MULTISPECIES: alpha/beta hydrolase [unclassified Nonomuraea]|uniref:alpha/beta fold hydrolase n=1 Tax=unclassified Nonomuraea TaxID=2593643 RepID=UPI0033E5E683
MSANALYAGRDWKLDHDKRVKVSNAELRYTVVGRGEPVLCIHCTSISDGLITPLLKYNPELLDKYQFISYYRAGYNGSTLEKDSLSIEEGAEHAKQLLDHLGIDKAHVMSYSFGGVIGFQFMLSYPERTHSAVLLEPYLPREGAEAEKANNDAVMTAIELVQKGDKLTAACDFMAAVCGPSYLGSVDMTCPLDVWERVEECADVTFKVDFPALGGWGFRMSKADQLVPDKPQMPVLAVMGLDSEAAMPGFREAQHFLMNWLPQAERCGIVGATHGLQIMNPRAVGEGVSAFLAKHPMQ